MKFYKVDDYSNKDYIGSRFRAKRFQFFEQKLKVLKRPVRILDIGGTVNFWVNEDFHRRQDISITVLNLEAEKSNYPNIKTITGDACNLVDIRDKQFDVAFSNSVIEHLFTIANQQKMANEAMRVAKYYFIQTPNKYFPIEPHFKFPLFQFLPDDVKIFLQTRTSMINGVKYRKEYAEKTIKEIRLLSLEELSYLFPESHVYFERFLGLNKSFIVHNMPDTPASPPDHPAAPHATLLTLVSPRLSFSY